MADKLSRKEVQQLFFEIADEMEKECGDWKSLPEGNADRVLREHIINKAKEKS